ncbi:MAG: putative large exoprotein [Gemmataceae bacterium]|nr:putative large exoprotein [Gemmataceae bacterium]
MTLVATVPALPGVTPTGTVDFTLNGTDLGQATLSGGTATLTSTFAFPAGINPITVSYSGDSSYNPTDGNGNITVAPATLAVAPDPQTMDYGGTVPALTYTPNGFVNGDTPGLLFGALATTATPASGVGGYAITQGTLSAGPNYTISVSPVTLTVRPATLTVTATAQATVYGAPVPDLTGAYAAGGFVNGESTALLQGSLGTDAGPTPAAGSYQITQGTLTAGPNYSIRFTGAALTVSPAALAVTADPKTMQYGDTLPALTYSLAGFVYGDTPSLLIGTLATAAVSGSGIGRYNITQWAVAAGANYAINYRPA